MLIFNNKKQTEKKPTKIKINVTYPNEGQGKTYEYKLPLDLNTALVSVSETWLKQKDKFPVVLYITKE